MPTRSTASRTASRPARRREPVEGLRIAAAVVFVLGGLTMAMPALAVILVIGLVPSLGAWLAETRDERGLTACVFSANLSATLSVALHGYHSRLTLSEATAIASDPFALLLMYGAAALGWMIFCAIPPLYEATVRNGIRDQLDALEERQRQLVGHWGPEVDPSAGASEPKIGGPARISAAGG